MSWDRVEKNWKAVKGAIEATLGTLNNNDIDVINGGRERLNLHGFDKEQARKEAERWAQEAIDQRVLWGRKPDKSA